MGSPQAQVVKFDRKTVAVFATIDIIILISRKPGISTCKRVIIEGFSRWVPFALCSRSVCFLFFKYLPSRNSEKSNHMLSPMSNFGLNFSTSLIFVITLNLNASEEAVTVQIFYGPNVETRISQKSFDTKAKIVRILFNA